MRETRSGGQGRLETLLDLLTRAAGGSWPPADGEIEVIGSPSGPADAVIAFTAYSIIAARHRGVG
jgi:hypothetical protein